MPLISVVVPIYKVEEYLKECVDSILNQNYSDFEVILVDDGSPDGCPAICDEYALKDSRVKVIHKENGGLSSARNAGMSQAKGEYVWFVDSDDYLSENAFEMIEKCFSTGADIFTFGILCKQYSGNFDKAPHAFSGLADKEKMAELTKKACSSHLYTYVWRSVYKAEFLKKNKLSFFNGLSLTEDAIFNSQAFLVADKVFFSDDFPYVYRDRSNGLSKNFAEAFDEKIIGYFVTYDNIRDRSYDRYCIKKYDEYYKDAGRFTLTNVYYYSIVNRIYRSKNRNKYKLLKKVSKTRMIKKAFERFDINEIKSKSLDWYFYLAVKRKWYFAGHLICKYFLFR